MAWVCSRSARAGDPPLDRALLVFWKKGYDGTSLTDLTEAMGINRPSLYAAYGNKQALFGRALERYGECAAEVFRAADRKPTARAFVEHVLRTMAVESTRPDRPAGCFLLQSTAGSCEVDAVLRESLAACRAGPLRVLQARFERAIAAGEVPNAVDAAGLARFYAAVLQGMSLQAAAGADAAALAAVVDMAMRAWPNKNRRPRT